MSLTNKFPAHRNERHTASSTDSRSDEAPKGTFKKMPLLDVDELDFFSLLSQAIDPSQSIFRSVPLEAILHPQRPSEKTFLLFKDINYLICDTKTTLPICAIDIGQLDPEVAYILNSAGIPVIVLKGVISSNDLRQMIDTAKPAENMPFPQQVHDVEVTVVGVAQQPVMKKQYPKIVISTLKKPLRKRVVEHSLWSMMIALILSAMYVVARVVWIYYTN